MDAANEDDRARAESNTPPEVQIIDLTEHDRTALDALNEFTRRHAPGPRARLVETNAAYDLLPIPVGHARGGFTSPPLSAPPAKSQAMLQRLALEDDLTRDTIIAILRERGYLVTRLGLDDIKEVIGEVVAGDLPDTDDWGEIIERAFRVLLNRDHRVPVPENRRCGFTARVSVNHEEQPRVVRCVRLEHDPAEIHDLPAVS